MSTDILFLGGTSIDLIQDKNNPRFMASTGGSITNSALIGAKLGLKTAMLSRIGNDPLGEFAIRSLRSCGVNVKGMIKDSNIRTSLAIATIDKSGNSKYTFYKNAAKDSIVPLKSAPKELLSTCKCFHFGSSFSYQKETYKESLKYLKYLKKRGAFISFDPNLRPYAIKDKKEAKNRVLKLLRLVDLAKISDVDLRFLTGQKDPKKGLKRLKKIFDCEIILTLGAKGSASMGSNGDLVRCPVFKVKIADTIGAGDAFTAGLLYNIIKAGEKVVFNNIKPYLAFASAVSALICAKPGSSQGLKDIRQVNSFLVKYALCHSRVYNQALCEF